MRTTQIAGGTIDECDRCKKYRVTDADGRVNFMYFCQGRVPLPRDTDPECLPNAIALNPHPSVDERKRFIQALADDGVITGEDARSLLGLEDKN